MSSVLRFSYGLHIQKEAEVGALVDGLNDDGKGIQLRFMHLIYRRLNYAIDEIDIPFGSAGLIGFVIRYTSLAQGPPLPFLQLLALPYLRYPLRFVAAAHQPPFWTAKMIIFLCLATW